MNTALTDKIFWKKYWENHAITNIVRKNISFNSIFDKYLSGKNYHTMIEIGGFPGIYSIYFYKYWNFKVTLLDYVINYNTISALLKNNDLKSNSIEVINADFFNYKINHKYDVVFSLGFIEHFDDIKNVLRLHWQKVRRNGTMIIGIPNFLGVNGIYQLLFDPDNLNVHNLKSMKIDYLISLIHQFDTSYYKVFYVSGAMVWLESLNTRPKMVQILTYCLNIVGIILKFIGINNKFFSTHIFVIAVKK